MRKEKRRRIKQVQRDLSNREHTKQFRQCFTNAHSAAGRRGPNASGSCGENNERCTRETGCNEDRALKTKMRRKKFNPRRGAPTSANKSPPVALASIRTQVWRPRRSLTSNCSVSGGGADAPGKELRGAEARVAEGACCSTASLPGATCNVNGSDASTELADGAVGTSNCSTACESAAVLGK